MFSARKPSFLSICFCLLLWLSVATLLIACHRSEKPQLVAEDFSCIRDAQAWWKSNANSELVRKAAGKLLPAAHDGALFFYGIGLTKASTAQDKVEGFLSAICREYADYPEMIQAKFTQIANINILKEENQNDNLSNLWAGLNGERYRKFLAISAFIADERAKEQKHSNPLPFNGCEIERIFTRYLDDANAIIKTHKQYRFVENDLKNYVASAQCAQTERDTFYLFRGDGYLRPLTPEALSMEAFNFENFSQCLLPKRVRGKNRSCTDYYERPFATRQHASQQLLRFMFFFPEEQRDSMRDVKDDLFFAWPTQNDGAAKTYIFNSLLPDGKKALSLVRMLKMARGSGFPSKVLFESRESLKNLIAEVDEDPNKAVYLRSNSLWNSSAENAPDQGLSKFFNLARITELEKVKDRFAIAFSRAAFFYRISAIAPSGRLYPTYSPWVTTSAFIHQSQRFAQRGYARGALTNQKHYWMHVVKINRRDIYRRGQLDAKVTPDFSRMWFEEAGFSDHKLSKDEMTWNRFGAVLPAETEAILYLAQLKP